MPRTKVQWCERALIVAPLFYCLCTTPKLFQAELARLKVKRENWPDFVTAGAGATTHIFENLNATWAAEKLLCIVTINLVGKARTHCEVVALIAHEAVHVWQRVRRALREDSPSDEFEAYSVQRIVLELVWALDHQTGHGRRRMWA